MKKLVCLLIIAVIGYYVYQNLDKIKEYCGMNNQEQCQEACDDVCPEEASNDAEECGPCDPEGNDFEIIEIETNELINSENSKTLREAVTKFYQLVAQEAGSGKAYLKNGKLIVTGSESQRQAAKQTIEAVKMVSLIKLGLVQAEEPGEINLSFGKEEVLAISNLNENYRDYIAVLKKAGLLEGEEIDEKEIRLTVWKGGPKTNALSYPILKALEK